MKSEKILVFILIKIIVDLARFWVRRLTLVGALLLVGNSYNGAELSNYGHTYKIIQICLKEKKKLIV